MHSSIHRAVPGLLLQAWHWVLPRDTKMFSRISPRLVGPEKLVHWSQSRVMGDWYTQDTTGIKRKTYSLGSNWLSFPLRKLLWTWNMLLSGLIGSSKIHPNGAQHFYFPTILQTKFFSHSFPSNGVSGTTTPISLSKSLGSILESSPLRRNFPSSPQSKASLSV